ETRQPADIVGDAQRRIGIETVGIAMTPPQLNPATIPSPSRIERARRPTMTGTILERRGGWG
ncbi:MAG: hypothetical protein ACJ8BH_04835, partial [Microvirga sp.]